MAANLQAMRRRGMSSDSHATNPVAVVVFVLVLAAGYLASHSTGQFENGATPWWMLISILPALYLLFALKIANQWEKAIVLRFGRFTRLAGPGFFMIVPIVETIPAWVDSRVMVTPFSAERTLTSDTVPINVDAVLFWMVWDAQKAALEVQDYKQAVSWAAQTALRDMIGKMALAEILVGRDKLDAELQKIIDQRTTAWGVAVQSVEIRDVIIPSALEDAMSRQAQAERERQARVILGESEKQIAESFKAAAEIYGSNGVGLHLRAMNMLFEGLKNQGALVIVPSTAVETMSLGGLSGITALSQSIQMPTGTGTTKVASAGESTAPKPTSNE
jgi:SPFH domain / Band 7 family